MPSTASAIWLTTVAGLGFGLLLWLGLGVPIVTGWLALFLFVIGFGCATAGIMVTRLHLDDGVSLMEAPKDWRTSWPSREALFVLCALAVMVLYALLLVLLSTRVFLVGFLGAMLCFGALLSSAMVYARIASVPRWNHAGTPVAFVSVALAGGALLSGVTLLSLWFLVAAGIIQVLVWQLDDSKVASIRDDYGPVHNPNAMTIGYLVDDQMAFNARQRRTELKVAAIVGMSVVPSILLIIFGTGGMAHLFALGSHVAGVMVARLLFFAEAEELPEEFTY